MEKTQFLQQVVLGKLDSHMEKNEMRTLPNTIHKNKLQMDERPRYRPHTIKLLEENNGQTLSDINDSNIFSDPPLRVWTIKIKINKWDLITLKSFCTAKETLNNTNRRPTEWEEIFPNASTDKGLISKIYKHLLQLHTKKQTTPSKNEQKI